jgi:hypothetical protein
MLNCLDLQKPAIIYPPATQEEVDKIQSEFALSFPSIYVQLLLCSNGLVIHHEFSSPSLYATHELAERNQT